MYVQLTIELITKAVELFCGKTIKEKKARKICKFLAEDDEVEKHHFCGTTCTGSKNLCMKEVEEDGMQCYVHNPERKCHGITNKGDRCGSVAKAGLEYCRHHLNQVAPHKKRHVKSKVEVPHTPEYVVDSEDDDAEPHKKKHSKKNKKHKKSKKVREIVESSEEDEEDAEEDEEDAEEDEEDAEEEVHHKKKHSKKQSKKVREIVESSEEDEEDPEDEVPQKKKHKKSKKAKKIVESSEEDEEDAEDAEDEVPHKKKHKKSKAKEIGKDISWTKYDENKRKFRKTAVEAPCKNDIIWKRCSFDNAHMYATNYCLNGNYLFKMHRTDTIVALLWKLPSRDDAAYCHQKDFPESYKQVLLNMGYTVDELPLDYKPYLHEDLIKTRVALHVQGQTEDDVASEVEVPSKKHKQVASSEDEHESTCEEDEHESTCEEDEELFKMSPTVVDISSALNVPPPKDVQWAMHANNKDVEYATNFMINGKHIIKLHGTNAYVALYTPENISGEGDVPEIGILEHSILSKLKLRPLSSAERKKLYDEDSEPESVEEDAQVDGPTDKSKVKWKKCPLDKALKYSTNLTVNGKYILKMHKEDIVLGLVAKEQLEHKERFTDFTLLEKQQLFMMGYLPVVDEE
jgi:hypothetical protein